MNSQRRNPIGETEITQKCIQHLAGEIELLELYIEVSNSICENVGVPTNPGVEGGSDQIQLLTSQSEKLSQQRDQFKLELAEFLDVPTHQATIRSLLNSIGTQSAETINSQRDRLLELESTIQKQNRTNSFLIRQTMDLYQRIAMELTDQKPSAPTYSSSGELRCNESGNLLQTDC